jgi:hypothetical protein
MAQMLFHRLWRSRADQRFFHRPHLSLLSRALPQPALTRLTACVPRVTRPDVRVMRVAGTRNGPAPPGRNTARGCSVSIGLLTYTGLLIGDCRRLRLTNVYASVARRRAQRGSTVRCCISRRAGARYRRDGGGRERVLLGANVGLDAFAGHGVV